LPLLESQHSVEGETVAHYKPYCLRGTGFDPNARIFVKVFNKMFRILPKDDGTWTCRIPAADRLREGSAIVYSRVNGGPKSEPVVFHQFGSMASLSAAILADSNKEDEYYNPELDDVCFQGCISRKWIVKRRHQLDDGSLRAVEIYNTDHPGDKILAWVHYGGGVSPPGTLASEEEQPTLWMMFHDMETMNYSKRHLYDDDEGIEGLVLPDGMRRVDISRVSNQYDYMAGNCFGRPVYVQFGHIVGRAFHRHTNEKYV
jgi:hypothetical protein